jgi:TonB-dependent SusC/RagA subfamily outer membrane receptor
VLHSSGTPGDPSRLRLRGAGSIQGNNDPIIIIDGIRVYASQSDPRNSNLAPEADADIPGQKSIQTQTGGFTAPSPLDQIDPASIETIEVLKGPAATAIYGSDAASGVIVITTKHGHAGPTHWNLAFADGVNWNPGSWPVNYFRFGSDGLQLTTQTNGMCLWTQITCAVDSIVAFQALNDPRYTVFSHGSDQQANLTVSGGLPTLTYSLTGSGTGDLGMLKLPGIEQQRYDSAYGPIPGYLVRPDNYTTWGVNGSLTALPTPTMRVTLQGSLLTSTQQQSSVDNAIPQLEGEFISPTLLTGPLITNDVERATVNQVTSTDVLSLHWQLEPWLPLDATGGLNTIQSTDNTYIPYGVNFLSPGESSEDTTGYYGVGRGVSHNNTLTAGTAIPLKLVTLAFGGNLYSQSTADFSVFTDQLAPGVTVPTSYLDDNGNNEPTTTSEVGQSTYGWYVEPQLNFASKFFVTPGFRLDGGSGGSTSSGSVGGLSAFPKIDLSYVAVDRPQHPLWGVLTLLRPRLAFGLAGTQPLPEDKLRLFNIGSYELPAGEDAGRDVLGQGGVNCQSTLTLNGTTTVPAVCLNELGNTQLRPERTRELEGGFDASLWRNRLQVTYTQYDKTTLDDIISIPVAPSVAGSFNIDQNIGTVRNTGTEVTINATVLESRVLSWNVGANLSNDNSLVVRLNPGQAPICLGIDIDAVCSGTRIVAGYPLFGVWARPIASFADANHDGIIEPTEIRYADSAVYVGQPNPKYQLNFTTGLTLFNGRLSVNATFAYQNGLTQDNAGACTSGAFSLIPNAPNTSLATQAAIVASGCGGEGNNVTDIGLLQTVNTLRFNALSVNYTVPRSVSTWIHVPRMTLALQGSNLALHTNYRGLDPDVNAFSTVSAGDETEDLGQIPEPRTWWLRMTLGD